MIFKPMLACRCTDPSKLRYPVLVTPKLDGIRCLKRKGKALTRSLKPIPNPVIRKWIEDSFPDGVDGELMVPSRKFCDVSSMVMRRSWSGTSQVSYWVFDFVEQDQFARTYQLRMDDLEYLPKISGMLKLIPRLVRNEDELRRFEQDYLTEGYEGIIVRSPYGPYKFGRSTEKEGYLLKIKRFEDGEAIIIGFEEKLHNSNEQMGDELRTTKRHTYKEGMVPMGTLGALHVQSIKLSRLTFSIGSGFDDEQRQEIWNSRKKYLGKTIKFKYQPYGMKDVPRFPTFLGFRDIKDMC